MKNSDTPAFSNCGDGQNLDYYHLGLTKREVFFKDILCAILSNKDKNSEHSSLDNLMTRVAILTETAFSKLEAPRPDNNKQQ